MRAKILLKKIDMDKFWPFLMRHWFLSVLFVVLFVIIVWYERLTQAGQQDSVSPQEAVNLINRHHAVILDLRSDSAFKQSHIVKSRHVDVGELDPALKNLAKSKKKPVILICDKPPVVQRVKKALTGMGFEQIVTIRGGLKAWVDAKLPLEKIDEKKVG